MCASVDRRVDARNLSSKENNTLADFKSGAACFGAACVSEGKSADIQDRNKSELPCQISDGTPGVCAQLHTYMSCADFQLAS